MHKREMDSEWFKSRKKELRVTDVQLAEAMGVERSVANKVVNGIVTFPARSVDKVAALMKVGSDEIIVRAGISSGRPSPSQPDRPLDMKRAPEQMPTRGAYDDVGAVKLRRLNLELAMGDGTDIEDWIEEQEVSFDANLFHRITSSPADRVFIGSGVGDSMHPTIGDHDDVLIDLNDCDLNKLDRIWAITIEGAGAVKRLMPAGKGMVEVLSDNPAHPNRVRTYPREAIKIIGRVVWSGRRH